MHLRTIPREVTMPTKHRIASVTLAAATAIAGIIAGASPGFASSQTAADSVVAPQVDRGIVLEIPRTSSDIVQLDLALPADTIFSVALYENATTGYTWSRSPSEQSEPFVVFLDTDFVLDPGGEGMPGAGGTRYFRYRTAVPGATAIAFDYRRPWEGTPIQQVVCNIHVD